MANLKLTDNWRGTTTQFILHFKEQLRLQDSLVPLDEQLPDSTRMALLQRAVEGVPDLRTARILDGVMTAKSGSFTTIIMKHITSIYKIHPSIMIGLFQKAPEGTKSRPMRYSLSLLKRLMITIPLLKMIPSPQSRKILVETYEVHMSNFKPKDNPSRVFIREKFSAQDRKLIIEYNKKIPPKTWSPSSGNTRTLPNVVGFQMVENQEASLATKDKKKELTYQIILTMKKHLAKINNCLP